MSTILIEELLEGAAQGRYKSKPGAQFGSLWGFDGLLATEASQAEYAAYSARADIRLCYGAPISWLGNEWSTILAYSSKGLAQVNIQTESKGNIYEETLAKLKKIFGEGTPQPVEKNDPVMVSFQTIWNAKDAEISLVRTPSFIQVVVTSRERSVPPKGCLTVLGVIACGLGLIAALM